MDFAIGVRGRGFNVGAFHQDNGGYRGHRGHSYGGDLHINGGLRFDGGGHHSTRGAVYFSNGGGGYHGGGYDPTWAGNRYEEGQIRRAIAIEEKQRYGVGGYDPTWAGNRYEERQYNKAIEREERMWREEERALYEDDRGRGSRYNNSPRSASFAVRNERELIERDRANAASQDEFPQETTGRPPANTSPQQASTRGVTNPAPEATTPPAAEQPRAAAALTAAEQKELNQKAQIYLEALNLDTGQLDANGKRTPGAGQKKLSAAGENTPLDVLAKEFDGVVGDKTRQALRAAGFDPSKPITQEMVDMLAVKLAAAHEKAAEQQQAQPQPQAEQQPQPQPQPQPVDTASVVSAPPVEAAVLPTTTMIGEDTARSRALADAAVLGPISVSDALEQVNAPTQREAAVAAAPVVPPAQANDVSVAASGSSPKTAEFFGAQRFVSETEASVAVQPGPVQAAPSQTLPFDIPVLKIAGANPQDVSAPGGALVFNGNGPRSTDRTV